MIVETEEYITQRNKRIQKNIAKITLPKQHIAQISLPKLDCLKKLKTKYMKINADIKFINASKKEELAPRFAKVSLALKSRAKQHPVKQIIAT